MRPGPSVRPSRLAVLVAGFTLGVLGCASFEGTIDRSRTLGGAGTAGKVPTIAIAPMSTIPSNLSAETAERITRRLEMKLQHSLRRALSGTRVVAAEQYRRTLSEKRGALARFLRWRDAYATSGRLVPTMIRQYAILGLADYVLVVRKAQLDRQRLPGEQAVERCPFRVCFGPRPHHIWRTDLQLAVDLIDLRRGRLVWSGVGAALNDYAEDLQLELAAGKGDPRTPEELVAVDEELVVTATDGVARQIAATIAGS